MPPSASPQAIIGGMVWFFVAGLCAAYLAQGYAAAAVGYSVAVSTVVSWYAVGWHRGREEGRAAERWSDDHPP